MNFQQSNKSENKKRRLGSSQVGNNLMPVQHGGYPGTGLHGFNHFAYSTGRPLAGNISLARQNQAGQLGNNGMKDDSELESSSSSSESASNSEGQDSSTPSRQRHPQSQHYPHQLYHPQNFHASSNFQGMRMGASKPSGFSHVHGPRSTSSTPHNFPPYPPYHPQYPYPYGPGPGAGAGPFPYMPSSYDYNPAALRTMKATPQMQMNWQQQGSMNRHQSSGTSSESSGSSSESVTNVKRTRSEPSGAKRKFYQPQNVGYNDMKGPRGPIGPMSDGGPMVSYPQSALQAPLSSFPYSAGGLPYSIPPRQAPPSLGMTQPTKTSSSPVSNTNDSQKGKAKGSNASVRKAKEDAMPAGDRTNSAKVLKPSSGAVSGTMVQNEGASAPDFSRSNQPLSTYNSPAYDYPAMGWPYNPSWYPPSGYPYPPYYPSQFPGPYPREGFVNERNQNRHSSSNKMKKRAYNAGSSNESRYPGSDSSRMKDDKPKKSADAKSSSKVAGNGKSEQKRTQSSKYRGVSWHKRDKAYVARVWVNGKSEHLGVFASEIGAALAVDTRLLALHGPNAKNLNFPDSKQRKEIADSLLATPKRKAPKSKENLKAQKTQEKQSSDAQKDVGKPPLPPSTTVVSLPEQEKTAVVKKPMTTSEKNLSIVSAPTHKQIMNREKNSYDSGSTKSSMSEMRAEKQGTGVSTAAGSSTTTGSNGNTSNGNSSNGNGSNGDHHDPTKRSSSSNSNALSSDSNHNGNGSNSDETESVKSIKRVEKSKRREPESAAAMSSDGQSGYEGDSSNSSEDAERSPKTTRTKSMGESSVAKKPSMPIAIIQNQEPG